MYAKHNRQDSHNAAHRLEMVLQDLIWVPEVLSAVSGRLQGQTRRGDGDIRTFSQALSRHGCSWPQANVGQAGPQRGCMSVGRTNF